jgi:uncharacterized membrane protein YccC
MKLAATVDGLGIDPVKFSFTLRTAITACLAMALANAFGLDHPQWAAMTVWIVAQPTRGQWLEKSLFRILGSMIGIGVGIGLVILASDRPWLLVLGIAIWIGFCAWAGNLLRNFLSYATILAGYSAAMIALLEIGHADQVLALAGDRMATISVGVAMSAVAGWLFAPSAMETDLDGRLRLLSAQLFRHLGAGENDRNAHHDILSQMAIIEETLDPFGSGSLAARRRIRARRRVLSSELALMVWANGRANDPQLSGAFVDIARAFENDTGSQAIAARLGRLASDVDRSEPDLARLLRAYAAALLGEAEPSVPAVGSTHLPMQFHRDWIGARHAFFRATGAILLVGAFWLVTDLAIGPFMLMGTAIMTSLFSTFDNPALMMRNVLVGSMAGVAAALACRFLALPLAESQWQMILVAMPFILFGSVAMAHRRTMAGGMDYNMVSLILLHPVFPLTGAPMDFLGQALSLLLAPLIAMLAYRLAFPVDARRRGDMVIEMMVHELQHMAHTPPTETQVRTWRARLFHRLLRLTRWSEKIGEHGLFATEGGLAVLGIGEAILAMTSLASTEEFGVSTRRALRAGLSAVDLISTDPERAASLFAHAAEKLATSRSADAAKIANAAELIRKNSAFFQRAASRHATAKAPRIAPKPA